MMEHNPNGGPGKTEVIAQHRFNDVADLDAKLLGLLEKRSYLLKREGAWRKSRNKSLVDPKLEKQLRAAFEKEAGKLGLDAKLAKSLFSLFNQFALADKRSVVSEDGYKLAPRREPVSASIAGPRSFVLTRLWQAMAASAGAETLLAPVTLNAPNKDMAKALKQAAGKVSWDDEEIRLDSGDGLVFEDAMVFVGEDTFNFYLLLALSLGHAGRCKFSGKPLLQLLDLAPMNRILPRLGARIVPMNPNNPGLPARLECGGVMDEEVSLPAEVDPDFAAALTLAAWSYAGGLVITDIPAKAIPAVSQAVSVLTACGIEAELDGNTCRVSDGVPEVPEAPEIPLDLELASVLLAIPAFSGGEITVNGPWPSSAEGDLVLEELEKLGLEIIREPGRIAARMEGELPKSASIALGNVPGLYPLALAFGLGCGAAELLGKAPEEALEILDRLGVFYTEEEDKLCLQPGQGTWEYGWASPDPSWSLAAALIAYRHPGILLDNHGEVTRFWPEFWNFYNSLPTGKMKPKPVKEETASVKRRRIKVRF